MNNLVPFSQEAEEAVIGAIIINPDALVDVTLIAEDFYFVRHQYIWQAIRRLADRHEGIDYVTLQDELRALNRLDEIGGSAYLTQLTTAAPSSSQAAVYGKIVGRTALRRRLLETGDELKQLAANEELSIEAVRVEAEQRMTRLWDTETDDRSFTMREAVRIVMDGVEERMVNDGARMGIPSGLKDLDDLTGNFQKEDFILIAARPAMGKTSLLLSIALMAAKLGVRIGFFSQEMGYEQLTLRLAAMETGINLHKLRTGALDQPEWRRFVQAAGRIGKLPIYQYDTAGLTPDDMRRQALIWRRRYGIDLLMQDYLQLMKGVGGNREQEVSHVARRSKELARELRIPLLSAAQLSRAVENRQDKRPQLADLRESGELEQATDLVIFLYREVMYNTATEFPSAADLIIAKHRNGPTGTVQVHFDRSLTKFSDATVQTVDLSDL